MLREFHWVIVFVSILLYVLLLSPAITFAETVNNFTINFESIVVKNSHDPPNETTRWDLDAYINGERVRLNPGGELSAITTGKVIPLGIQKEIQVAKNETIGILTIGIDEERGVNEIKINDTQIQDFTPQIKVNLSTGATEIDIERLLKLAANSITQLLVKENEPLGQLVKVYSSKNGFGIGSHNDCSSMNTNVGLTNLESQQKTACDYILKYSIRETDRSPQSIPSQFWNNSNWKIIEGLSIDSAPSVISNGPGKVDVFGLGTDGILWHRGYDYGWNGWEPLSTYSNIPGTFLPSNSSAGLASWDPSRLDVFVKGNDNHIWHKWLEVSKGQWQDWEEIKGVISSEPSTFSLEAGDLSLFAVDKNPKSLCTAIFRDATTLDSTGWLSRQNSACSANADTDTQELLNFRQIQTCKTLECNIVQSLLALNYTIKSVPVIIPTLQGRIDTFALVDDNKIWHGYYVANQNGEWKPVANETVGEKLDFVSKPSIISKQRTAVNLDLYSRLLNGSLIRANYDGNNWKDWQSLGEIPSSPSVIYWEDPQRTYVFAKNGTSLVYNWEGESTFSNWDKVTTQTNTINKNLTS